MKLISINREFGSGGRELGRKLAENLGFDYYDKSIIDMIAQKHGLDTNFVEKTLEKGLYSSSFSSLPGELLFSQTEILHNIAKLGNDCVIVGRSADTILCSYNPLKIFVYSDFESKMNRCKQNAKEGENWNEKSIIRKMKTIDTERIRTKELLSGKQWGVRDNYDLMINTSNVNIDKIIPSIASFALAWFD